MIPKGTLVCVPDMMEHGLAVAIKSKWDNFHDHWVVKCYWAMTGDWDWIPHTHLQEIK